ncbi:hypothetical protein HK098_000403 [Nowakowskiella sp. JEL0407]|nr:hypothetical protein HK098_000403 [Nowakowskiella sp. JEL0407]
MVALGGDDISFVNTTLANGTVVWKQTSFIEPWDLTYFLLFDRFLVQFDIPTLLIIFIDGFTWKKRVAFCIIMHWIFRNIGGMMFGIIKYVDQADRDNLWRYTTGLPSLPWYLGELFLDSYPFQKAWAVAGDNFWLKVSACIGFYPLVGYKVALVVFRYFYTIKAPTKDVYFGFFNLLDAGAITAAAWNDVWSCFVIVLVGWQSRKKSQRAGEDDFLSNLVRTTELRIVICTVLSIFAAALIFQEGCFGDSAASSTCKFAGARNIAIDIVYGLYYLDYLIIKYYKVVKGEKSTPVPIPSNNARDMHEWPQPKYTADIDLDMTTKSAMMTGKTDIDTPSFAIMKSDLRQRTGMQPQSGFGGPTYNAPFGGAIGGNGMISSPQPRYDVPPSSGNTTTVSSTSQQHFNMPKMQYASVGPATPRMQQQYSSQNDYGHSSSDDQQTTVWYQSSGYQPNR